MTRPSLSIVHRAVDDTGAIDDFAGTGFKQRGFVETHGGVLDVNPARPGAVHAGGRDISCRCGRQAPEAEEGLSPMAGS
jgi:hypothetical protein